MHLWSILAFILAGAAAVVAATQRAWVLVLLSAAFCAVLVPAVFELRS